MADRLSDATIDERLSGGAWRRDGEAITRTWQLTDFRDAIAFVGRVAEAAEAAGHHPDILVHAYRQVTLWLSTHSAGGLTDADFALAATLDGL